MPAEPPPHARGGARDTLTAPVPRSKPEPRGARRRWSPRPGRGHRRLSFSLGNEPDLYGFELTHPWTSPCRRRSSGATVSCSLRGIWTGDRERSSRRTETLRPSALAALRFRWSSHSREQTWRTFYTLPDCRSQPRWVHDRGLYSQVAILEEARVGGRRVRAARAPRSLRGNSPPAVDWRASPTDRRGAVWAVRLSSLR